jgi:hypothetical protein
MSREALEQYQDARQHQLAKSEARHIRTRVYEARNAPHVAGLRWPFELLQNALDAGPRENRDSVAISLREETGRVIFEHDGAPFSMAELAALLSGGSSKEFDSDETTGRFGTGFLVTHVLAERTSLQGLLALDHGFEQFDLTLDRGGDEVDILENIDQCNEAIERAEFLPSPDGVPSARFEYPIEEDGTFGIGLDAFRAALPYLYGTRPRLGAVQFVRSDGATESWSCGKPAVEDLDDGIATGRLIHVRTVDAQRTYRIIRFSGSRDSPAAVLVLTEQTDSGWTIVLPRRSEPRVYREYPLRGSGFLPVEFIIDGRFAPDQERNKVLMNDSAKEIFTAAFGAAVTAVKYSFENRLGNRHFLAQTSMPESGFDSDDSEELAWWSGQLGSFAGRLALLPIVETTVGNLPTSVEDGSYADFILPRLHGASTADETSVSRMWPLLSGTTVLYPPLEELALEWSEIARGWRKLGVQPNQITIEDLARYVSEGADEISELAIAGNQHSWLSRYIDVVGECWERLGGVYVDVLKGMLPNQREQLSSPNDLRIDVGVPEDLKDICDGVDLDIRKGLASARLVDSANDPSLVYARNTLSKAIPRTADADDISLELLKHLKSALPEGAECTETNDALQRGTALFLSYLWRVSGQGAADIAREVPLVARSKKVVYWSRDRLMMAPVAGWKETASSFAEAYPQDRLLDDVYMATDAALVSAFEAWGMAHADPVIKASAAELRGSRLAEMVLDGFDSGGVTVRGEEFGQIALLQPEIFNHIQDSDQARALLGMVLCHVVTHDTSWRERKMVRGTKERESVEVPIRCALWLGDLRSRAWVPIRGEDDRPAKVAANPTSLTPLLDPSWLNGNDNAIVFLTECFGFDELELRLLGIGSDVQERVRQGLARIIETGGADPAFYEALAREVEARRRRARDVERSRRMGYAVQDAVRQALEALGLSVELVDHGYDYEVSLPMGSESLEDAAVWFEVGPYFVEVKATSTGPARLTPKQAETATENPTHYVLCVVDLRGVPEERLDQEWNAGDIEPLASIVTDIGDRVSDTCVLVHRARDSSVGIRNEAALRYEVSPETWMTGINIADWVASISNESKVQESDRAKPSTD